MSAPTVIIGLEVHVQLDTATKVFCGCPNRFNPDEPNVQTCPVCLGLPGALPVLNERAIELSIRAGLGLNCEIARTTKWDRKQYHYPDLPKGYQTSQYDMPICGPGRVRVDLPTGEAREVRINRAHLEEDAGKNVHAGKQSRVDLNRAGTPLLEIVTEPDLRSALEAKQFLQELRLLMRYLEVSDCNMQEGSLRCDANVNLQFGTDRDEVATPIVEVKNLNSFRSVEQAIDFEVKRQQKEFERTGLTIETGQKETRGWDADAGKTFAQRGKEGEADYRYFPCPDLLPVVIPADRTAAMTADLPERPDDRRRRFGQEMGLSDYDAGVLIESGREIADYFEAAAAVCESPKAAANWVTQDVLRELNEARVPLSDFAVPADVLGDLLRRIEQKEIATKGGRTVFEELVSAKSAAATSDIDRIIDEKSLALVGGGEALEDAITEVLEANPKIVADLKAGKQQAAGPLIGQVMKQVAGADPKVVRETILRLATGK